jgi:hypothetical protein
MRVDPRTIDFARSVAAKSTELTRTQKLGWCWKIGDTVLSSDRAAEQIFTSFVLLIEKKPS